jgi:hypothetical protein
VTSCSLNLIAPLLLVSGVRLRLGLGDVCPHSVLALQLAVSPILGFGFGWLCFRLIGIALGSAVESTGSGSSSRLDLLMASSSLSLSLGEARGSAGGSLAVLPLGSAASASSSRL